MTSLDESLIKISKGAGIAFVGSLAALLFAFLGRVLVARIGTESEYGIFSIAFVVLNVCTIIATLGLPQGTARSIAYAKGENKPETMQKLISTSIQLSLLASIFLGIILFFSSHFIASKIFHDDALVLPLKIFALGIPFFALIYVFVSIFRGFDDVKPKVYFQDISRSAIFLLLLLLLILFELPFSGVFYVFLASLVISFAVLTIYFAKRLPSPMKFVFSVNVDPVTKNLLFFSLPLLGVAMLGLIITWTDTLMLGYFTSLAKVGLYNAALPFAQFISATMGAMLLIYMPVTTGLYARRMMPEIRRNFTVLTKWSCSITLPLFLILFLYPRLVLNLFFGADYILADNALRILSLGFIISNFMGPNGGTLIALGRSNFIMWVSLGIALLNIGLNIILIPLLGIEGAAIASAVSITIASVLRYWKVYSLTGTLPLSKNLIKPVLFSLTLVFLFHFIITNFFTVSLWILPLLFTFYYTIYGLATLFTKSFDKEDIALLLAIEKKAGINLSFINRVLQRFL
jgi:O-antigen/teichoic acid export membrane protein